MSVSIRSRQQRVRVPLTRLGRLAARTLAAVGHADREVHVTLVDDAEIRRLHRRYLGVGRRTDVLAFDLDRGARRGQGAASRRPARGAPRVHAAGPGRGRPSMACVRRRREPPPLLGEVVISAETAARQADQLGVAPALELDLLLVHGLLHLVGYDDHVPAEAKRMHERAREILSAGRRRPLPARLWTGLLSR